MSLSDLKAYGQRIATDPEVKAAADAIGMSHPQGHVEFAQTLGYSIDVSDLVALAREQRPPDGELTEEQLSSVSGGEWVGFLNFIDPKPIEEW